MESKLIDTKGCAYATSHLRYSYRAIKTVFKASSIPGAVSKHFIVDRHRLQNVTVRNRIIVHFEVYLSPRHSFIIYIMARWILVVAFERDEKKKELGFHISHSEIHLNAFERIRMVQHLGISILQILSVRASKRRRCFNSMQYTKFFFLFFFSVCFLLLSYFVQTFIDLYIYIYTLPLRHVRASFDLLDAFQVHFTKP